MDGSVIRVGPAGWSYPDWSGVTYPHPLPPRFRPLRHIAQWFDVGEANVSYYRIPTARTAASWVADVADFPNFRFTAKLHRAFTHDGRLDAAEVAEFHRFLDPLAEAGRLDALLLQFPWSFRDSAANRQHLLRLFDAFRAHPLVVETRHDSWWTRSFFDLLRGHEVSIANIDQPELEHNIPPDEVLTGPIAYIRFHGRNAGAWWAEKEAYPGARYDYLYSAEELAPWVARTRRLARSARLTVLIMNNHARGESIVNGLEMAASLGLARGTVPTSLRAMYPGRLESLGLPFEVEETTQGDLFP